MKILCFTLRLSTAFALLFLGCARQEPDDLLQTVLESEQRVHKLHSEKDAKAARASAKDAWEAANKLEALARKQTNDVAIAKTAGEAMTHARVARDEADLAMNEWERAKALDGFVGRSYLRMRGTVTPALLNSLADAADIVAQGDLASAPPAQRELAKAAIALVGFVESNAGMGTQQGTNAVRTDWARVATSMRSYATNQPPAVSLALACGFLGMGQADLAVVEMETISKDRLTTPNDITLYHLGRTFIYLSRGWTQLATPEVAALAKSAEGQGFDGKAAGSIFHAYCAIEAGSRRDLGTLDFELAKAVQAWPENPLLAFVTGERLAADGRWEEAAESLEKEAKGSKHEWAAKRMAQRARDLRDGKGSSGSAVIDTRFLTGFAMDWAATAGKDTVVGKWVINSTESGKAIARAVLEKIPLVN